MTTLAASTASELLDLIFARELEDHGQRTNSSSAHPDYDWQQLQARAAVETAFVQLLASRKGLRGFIQHVGRAEASGRRA